MKAITAGDIIVVEPPVWSRSNSFLAKVTGTTPKFIKYKPLNTYCVASNADQYEGKDLYSGMTWEEEHMPYKSFVLDTERKLRKDSQGTEFKLWDNKPLKQIHNQWVD